MQEFSLTLVKKEYLNDDILILEFSKPPELSFLAGQFLQFLVPDGDATAVRAYSISSSPSDPELQFCVKILPDGLASQWFASMQPGAVCTARGPRGMFHVASEDQSALCFIATGTGIAPVMGIIKDQLLAKQTARQITVLFGVRSEHDLFWVDELKALASSHEQFTAHITLSQPTERWDGLTGRVTEHLPSPSAGVHYFLCGSAPMVKDVRAILLENDILKEAIHFEIF